MYDTSKSTLGARILFDRLRTLRVRCQGAIVLSASVACSIGTVLDMGRFPAERPETGSDTILIKI
jgi:hypothetical protein